MLSLIPIKVWIIGGILIAAIILGALSYHAIYQEGYNAAAASYKAASAKALADAEARAKSAQDAQEAATAAIESNYDQKLKDAAATANSLTAAVLRYKAQLRGSPVSPNPGSASQPDAPAEGSSGDGAINAAIANAISACEQDAAELTALQTWAVTLH